MAKVWQPDTVVLLWNTYRSKWEEVAVVAFKDARARTECTKVHPDGIGSRDRL
jgi:hypothetical protein